MAKCENINAKKKNKIKNTHPTLLRTEIKKKNNKTKIKIKIERKKTEEK